MIALVNANSLAMPLADGSVHMIATSPPYWGLRDYQLGDAGLGLEPLHDCLGWATGHNCGACYVCRMRLFARECWRVLRDDGVMWLNLGDSYANSSGHNSNGTGASSLKADGRPEDSRLRSLAKTKTIGMQTRSTLVAGLKPKDLVGIPWRVALALQADGWYLRSDIIWAKPNPMPESVTDRPTKAHEYVFLLAKSARYYYDADAVREPHHHPEVLHISTRKSAAAEAAFMGNAPTNLGRAGNHEGGRNRRTVWTIATQPYSGAHFATWPEALVEPMVKAGTSERGCCPECGKAWERVLEKVGEVKQRGVAPGSVHKKTIADGGNGTTSALRTGMVAVKDTIGWQPTCACDAGDPIPCTVLDPFAGSGTTGVVARRLGRRFVGLDLSLPYLRDQARTRLELDRLADWHTGTGQAVEADDYGDLPLFGRADD